MENQQMANREMNFFDLCVACARAVGRGCVALWHLFAHMLRLTYRYWWLVLTLVVVAVAGSWYYTRVENTIYKVNAVALLNGPTIQQFEQAYTPLRAGIPVEPDQPLNRYMTDREATCFTTFRVVDCFHDGIADMWISSVSLLLPIPSKCRCTTGSVSSSASKSATSTNCLL